MSEKVSTYSNDEALPTLPLPTLGETLERLRQAIIPHASAEQLKQFDDEVPKMTKALEEAQKFLESRRDTQNNWLSDWWDEFAYLRSRTPVVINTNILAVRTVDLDDEWKIKPVMSDQIGRAALCVKESLHFHKLLVEQKLKPERLAGQNLCMQQFKRYWSTRIPRKDMDEVVTNEPTEVRYVIFMVGGKMFSVDPFGANGEPLSFNQLKEAITVGVRQASHVTSPPVGALSAAPRDKAAEVYELIRDKSPKNEGLLELLNSSLTLISLDDKPVNDPHEGLRRACMEEPHNRYYERASSQIVATNGVCLFQGEHSPMDAIVSASTPIEIVSNYGVEYAAKKTWEKETPAPGFNPQAAVTVMQFDTDEKIDKALADVIAEHQKLSSTCQIGAFRHPFGKKYLKSKKVSADAFVQIAIQCAALRDRGRLMATYESASTRLFKEGRTETILSLTDEMKTFVQAFTAKRGTPQELQTMFRAAVEAHSEMTYAAATGAGITRHLMGLRIACGYLDQEYPKMLLEGPVAASHNFELLTSQMLGKTFLGGFGHTLPDGYGVCYYLHADEIRAVVSGNASAATNPTDVKRFIQQLGATMDELKSFVDGSSGSKL